jgi:hypothetical protein
VLKIEYRCTARGIEGYCTFSFPNLQFLYYFADFNASKERHFSRLTSGYLSKLIYTHQNTMRQIKKKQGSTVCHALIL